MKTNRIIDQFRAWVIITELDGKSNVVTSFSFTAENILNQFYESPKQKDIVAKKYRIIETAAKLIKMTLSYLKLILLLIHQVTLLDKLRKL